MQPLKLSIKNFCSHSDTEFSFNDFSSALVIGKVKDNDRFSNGAGKSTVFNAIEYVLFNEIHFSSLEKIIRDGCDICRVELEFLSSLDKSVYKIIRSNSRKTGTDVRLFKSIGEGWEDLTQRRVSDTEREIVKIVGFNYKAFCASVLFSQAGSENNVQRDFGNLPALTPERRKSILREVLQLNVYSNYEKLAKAKSGAVQASLERQKIVLSTIGDPEVMLVDLTKNNDTIDAKLKDNNISLADIKKQIASLKSEHTILSEKISNSRAKLNEAKNKVFSCNEQVLKNSKTVADLKFKISKLPEEAKEVQNQIKDITIKLAEIKANKTDIDALKQRIAKISEEFMAKTIEATSLSHKIAQINKPITDDEVCIKCHQIVSEEHKHNWRERSKNELPKYIAEQKVLDEQRTTLEKAKKSLEKEIDIARENDKLVISLEEKHKYLSNDIQSKRNLYKNYNSLLEEHIALLKEKNIELNKAQIEFDALSACEVDYSVLQSLDKLNTEITKLSATEFAINRSISDAIGEQAIIKHRIAECEENKKKIVEIKNDIQELEKSLLLHSKVVQAFGSNGIPSLITHSILDELQEEANKWLLKLRPGLQLQFIVINDKNKKEQEDTLDILYFIDGNQREYKQLSGAQKIVVSLAIKLGLLFIMNKRLGVDIKLMLLDEVDQALDPGSTEIFADIIKILQEELKVMVITHDDDLKHKFSHAILVEQDENNISRGKLINW